MDDQPRIRSKNNVKRLLTRNTAEKMTLSRLSDQYDREKAALESRFLAEQKNFIAARKVPERSQPDKGTVLPNGKHRENRRSLSVYSRPPELIIQPSTPQQTRREMGLIKKSVSTVDLLKPSNLSRRSSSYSPAGFIIENDLRFRSYSSPVSLQSRADSEPDMSSDDKTPLSRILPPVTLPPIHWTTKNKKNLQLPQKDVSDQDIWEALSDCRYLRKISKSEEVINQQ